MPSNLERMIQLAEEFFATKNDPDQLSVTPTVLSKLKEIHPASLSEHDDGNGPVAWILLIPTTHELMNRFLENEMNERELFEKTPVHVKYDAIYLCSALVLPEYRKKGLAGRLTLEAILSICKDHPINSLFYWGFSKGGDVLAEAVARDSGIPLRKKIG